ncbi:Nucleoside diphosphate-linked moiety X motif 19, mitochondrial [Coemansia sp. 'formosensis']|nr:Nucleoside diphosphate-linked moiety X motif 19, mitochondrial [Coemansia sp. 'formosensis']
MDAPKLCAIRETYEETGLLLTTPCRPDRQREIQSQVDSMLSLSALCSRRGIRPLDPRPIGRWITPRAKQRRFDTWFYMLNIGDTDNFLLDQLESGRVQQEELEGMHWLCPGEVLRENARSKTALFPPQFYILSELARYKRWQDLAGYSPSTSPIEPLLCPRSDGKVVALLPGDRAYPTTAMAADCGPPTASGLAISDADLFGEDRVEESGMHRIVMEPTNKPGGFYAASLHQGHLIAAGRTARL